MKKGKLLFLYSELAGYFLACLKALAKEPVEIHVVHFKTNPEAPFRFDFPAGIHFYERQKFSDEALTKFILDLNPDWVYCSGWIDHGYLKAVKSIPKSIPKTLGLDNPWKGSFRQIAGVFFRSSISSVFDSAWVPGSRQEIFAKKLGFKKVYMGVYSGDMELFGKLAEDDSAAKTQIYPKRFLFVGRYNPVKGLDTLVHAYTRAFPRGYPWELFCAGEGDLKPILQNRKGITDLGFIQPTHLPDVIRQCGVFILPSKYEPWGVALHEMAAAGMPMIASNETGAAECFVSNERNGFLFPAGDTDSLEEVMIKISSLPDEKLVEMSRVSHRLSQKINPQSWVEAIRQMRE